MKYAWLIACLAAACTFGGAARSGEELDAGIDAPEPGPVDTDADSVLDAEDNCPATANADQRDHDGDQRGDVCDPCPHLAPVSGAGALSDRDVDGVGDACDPNPDTGTDRFVWFDGFDDPATLARYGASPAVWTIADGHVTQTQLVALAFLLFTEVLERPMVATRVETVQLGQPLNFGGVWFNPVFGTITSYANEVAVTRGQGCTLRWDAQTIIANRAGSNATEEGTAWPAAIGLGESYSIVHRITDRNLCSASGPSAIGTDDEALGPNDGYAGLALAQTIVSYDYLFIVDQAPLP